jgi:NADH:ubiquinone oxidoreductase subunit F (NADH-binding)
VTVPRLADTSTAPPGSAVPRLLAGLDAAGSPVGLDEHLSRWGAVPWRHAGASLIDDLEAAGLAGHGGAWFPVAVKWRSVRGGLLKRPVVVANAAEGEPASSKDELLVARLPHLVLDGASVAGDALGAGRVIVYAPRHLLPGLDAAVAERRRRALDPVDVEVVEAEDAFLSGQETAVVNALNRKAPLPAFAGVETIRTRGVGGRPTLVQNVETLAHAALIARFGPAWFRAVGSPGDPGTMLLTVHGRGPMPRIVEAPLGTRLGDVLGLSADDARQYWGALLGGYGGGWLPMSTALDLPLVESEARRHGTSLGAGVVALLPAGSCPLAETARVVRYLDRQKADQCGPCVNGLAELSALCTALAVQPAALGDGVRPLLDVCALVEGRGACRHPDGAARLVRSALAVFDHEVRAHLRHGPCAHVAAPGRLPGLGRIELGWASPDRIRRGR